ncbi:MAG: sporulation protein [Pseudonocardia sp.]
MSVDLELATDRATYLPGDAVTARLRLVARAEFDEVECSVALVHRDRYAIGGSTHDDDRAVAGEYVLDTEPLRAGTVREWTVVLPVPRRTTPPAGPQDCADERYPSSGDDADPESYDLWIEPDERWGPPTSVGPGASSSWVVRCEISGRGTPDPVDVPVVVAAPAVAMPADPPARVGSGTPRCTVAFHGLPRGSVAPGAALRGSVRITAREELSARSVRVELARIATVTSGRGESVTRTVVAQVTASGPVELAPRRPRDLAFDVTVPADAGPSVVGGEYRVDWVLRAVVDRPLRRDEVWEQLVAVHTAP